MSKFNYLNSVQEETTDLHKACRLGDLRVIKKVYETCPEKINERDSKTVICGHIEATKFLLEHKADPNMKNNLGETPLHQAADNSQYKLVQLLLQYKADPNAQQNDGDTPLHHAAFRGDIEMIKMLLEAGANPNINNFVFGRTPLHYAVDCGHLESVKLMLKHGANPRLKDRQGKRALILAQTKDMVFLLKEVEEQQEDRPILSNYVLKARLQGQHEFANKQTESSQQENQDQKHCQPILQEQIIQISQADQSQEEIEESNSSKIIQISNEEFENKMEDYLSGHSLTNEDTLNKNQTFDQNLDQLSDQQSSIIQQKSQLQSLKTSSLENSEYKIQKSYIQQSQQSEEESTENKTDKIFQDISEIPKLNEQVSTQDKRTTEKMLKNMKHQTSPLQKEEPEAEDLNTIKNPFDSRIYFEEKKQQMEFGKVIDQQSIFQQIDCDEIEKKIFDQFQIFQFLKSLKLEMYTENFLEAGYDEIGQLIEMSKKDLLNDKILKDLGIERPGYRARIITSLEQKQGLFPVQSARSTRRSVKSQAVQPQSGFACCVSNNNIKNVGKNFNIANYEPIPNLSE